MDVCYITYYYILAYYTLYHIDDILMNSSYNIQHITTVPYTTIHVTMAYYISSLFTRHPSIGLFRDKSALPLPAPPRHGRGTGPAGSAAWPPRYKGRICIPPAGSPVAI